VWATVKATEISVYAESTTAVSQQMA
jgi:hypothetical protein